MPFLHPEREIWIDVHTNVSPRQYPLAHDDRFSWSAIASQLSPIAVGDETTYTMNHELQLVYTSARWAEKFDGERGVHPLLDAALLIHKHSDVLDWDRMRGGCAWILGRHRTPLDAVLCCGDGSRARAARSPPQIRCGRSPRQSNSSGPVAPHDHHLYGRRATLRPGTDGPSCTYRLAHSAAADVTDCQPVDAFHITSRVHLDIRSASARGMRCGECDRLHVEHCFVKCARATTDPGSSPPRTAVMGQAKLPGTREPDVVAAWAREGQDSHGCWCP